MIRVYAPAIDPRDLDRGMTRVGTNILVEDAKYVLCIDGRCGAAADRVVKRLHSINKIKIMLLSHAHYDHYNGLEKYIDKYDDVEELVCQNPASLNKKYSDEAKGNIEALERIIAKAKKKGIKVIYATDGQKFAYGDIEFTTYRDQPSSARNTETYINAGSLCVWFQKIKLLYTGDTGADCAIEHGLHPAIITGLHHDNWFAYDHAIRLKEEGCKYLWDDDYSTEITNFLYTGRRNAIRAKMITFVLHGDLNICAFNGKVNIYKNGKTYSYTCPYAGKNTMKSATLLAVYNVFSGKYGTSDSRVTKLLDLGFNPNSVQGWVNKFAEVVK